MKLKLTLTACLALAAAPALAGGEIRGEVADALLLKSSWNEAGRLPQLAGARVTLQTPAEQPVAQAVTDGQGRYRLGDIPEGEYCLLAESPDYRPFLRRDIRVREGRVLRINLELLPLKLPDVPPVNAGPPETGGDKPVSLEDLYIDPSRVRKP
ncbi:carboxypeptidase-like regulatory domain-containing protein [Fluviicoccus keumensis]|nr:carboxypeptidase-like regulatory domain-containing protein [Fluviicoccus keumensis]